MEMPDVIYAAEYFDIDSVSLKEWREKSITGSEKYYHSRIVEALKAENEELKAKLDKAKWQPIETAPHGVWILISAYDNVMQACWNSNGYWETFINNRIYPKAATHWMPLPDAPEKL